MPILTIYANVPAEKLTKELNLHFNQLLATTLNIPLHFCSTHLISDQNLSFGGTFEPCAQIKLASFGSLGLEENKKHTEAIQTVLEEKLGIPPTRSYILFINGVTSHVGFNKTTFAFIFPNLNSKKA